MMAYRFFDGAVPPEALDWFRAVQELADPSLIREVARLVRSTDLTPLLRDLDLPTLLMRGQQLAQGIGDMAYGECFRAAHGEAHVRESPVEEETRNMKRRNRNCDLE